MNLYLILHAFFHMIFLDFLVSLFIPSPKLPRNSVFGWQRRAQIPIIKKFWSVRRRSARPPPRWGLRPLLLHRGLRPWTRYLTPYTPSFPLYTRLSWISGGGLSSRWVHTLCRTLRTKLHKIAYETRAYFFTSLLRNILFSNFWERYL